MSIGTMRNGMQFVVKSTEKGFVWRNMPRHLSADNYAAFIEAFRQILTTDAKGRTIVDNIMSLVGVYAIAAGYNFTKDVTMNPYLKALVSDVLTYWDYSGNEFTTLHRAKVKTSFIALLNQVDCGYRYKNVSGKSIDNIIRGKLVSINGNSGNAKDTRPSERQIIKQVCLEIYSITSYKTEKRYAPIDK